MPTFSAIALDRLLEPGASTSPVPPATAPKRNTDVTNPSPKLERRNTADDMQSTTKKLDIPPPHPQLRRRNSLAFTEAPEKKTPSRSQITPALYATPESTPLPDSPTSSFPPSSPYIINHKRRGPRLLKSLSEQNVAAVAGAVAVADKKESDGEESKVKVVNGHSRSLSEDDVARERNEEGFGHERVNVKFQKDGEVELNGSNGDAVAQEVEINASDGGLVGDNGELKVVIGSSSERDGETEDFFDPQESMGYTINTDGDDYAGERSSARAYTPMGEFYDAWEELSSDSGRQAQRSLTDVETELREMRLSLLMEIEKRKQAEEALNSMRSQWQILREKLVAVGMVLPDISSSSEDSQSVLDLTEEICRQIHVTRFVSESIGRGIAKSEAEAEMEAQLEVKNFEIARLCDRLHYYETMNREMSHRNQEAIEIARQERQKRRKRRQKWLWGSIATAITLGSAALAWSYLPSGKGSSSTNSLETPESDKHVQ